ncbi:MAG: S1 family peptidase [Gammaproteobacteria bacterium]|nr:S1 family peptidase [Gammaproteobacteria bacterium]
MRKLISIQLIGFLLLGFSTLNSYAIESRSTQTNFPVNSFEIEALARDRQISQQEAEQRLTWQKNLEQVDQLARQELDSAYGGLWIDVNDGDRLKVGVVQPGDATTSYAIQNLYVSIPHPDALDIVPVQRTLAWLERANKWVVNELNNIENGRLSVGIRTDLNAIEIEQPQDRKLSSREHDLINRAKAWMGQSLVFNEFISDAQPNSCSYPYCDAPLRGGIHIGVEIDNQPGRGCTGAFIAKSKVDDKLYQFTAGHCLKGTNNSWFTRFSDNSLHFIGEAHNFRYGNDGDMGIMHIDNVPGWRPENWVYVTDGPGTTVDESYAITQEGFSFVGMRICATGAYFGRSECGEVTKLGVLVWYPGDGWLHNMGKANYCAVNGDSGAPLYALHTAHGLHSGSRPTVLSHCVSYYQGIIDAENKMNVNIIHN